MRKEILNWWRQAQNDFEKAQVLFDNKKFDGAAFFCQQCLEKGIKAYILLRKKESPGPIHSLIRLGKIAGLPQGFFKFLRELSPEYYLSRYPDATEDVPYTLYSYEEVKVYLSKTSKVMKWLNIQIKE